ncbi:uncharacterized protein G2W53_025853 [Senna tora]|uniref:Uncharacterized protein n=1 Tax=Senna tora TaxID=362788 RepID=A0A834WGX1_9FABA|nr:uncharacterized protein G2W53_025853 [Senna tora]
MPPRRRTLRSVASDGENSDEASTQPADQHQPVLLDLNQRQEVWGYLVFKVRLSQGIIGLFVLPVESLTQDNAIGILKLASSVDKWIDRHGVLRTEVHLAKAGSEGALGLGFHKPRRASLVS